jgi:4-hydroxybenzoate polyprenyltransferase
MGYHTLRQTGHPTPPPEVFLPIFGGTLAAYTFLASLGARSGEWSEKLWRALRWPAILSGMAMAAWYVPVLPIVSLVPAGLGMLLVLAYFYPVPGIGKPLRQWPYAKVFHIAVVWTLITMLFPLLAGPPLPTEEITLAFVSLILARFAFVVAITLPFDLRDLNADRREGTHTLPLRLGWPATRRIALLALLLSAMGEGLYLHDRILPPSVILAVLISHLAALVLIHRTDAGRQESYYTFWLDGVLLLPLLIYTVAS